MAELMNRAKTFMGVEDYRDGRRSGHQSSRRRDESGSEPSKPRKRVNKGGHTTDSRPPTSQKPRLASNFRDYSSYTPLNATVEQIYDVARDKFTAPTPMKGGLASRDRSRYCEFHRDYGHTTAQCFHLRKQILTLIQKGELKEFVLRLVGAAAPADNRP